MTDRRDTPNPLWAQHETAKVVTKSVVDLLDAPNGKRDRQVIFGEAVTHLGSVNGMAYIRAEKDGYHGFVTQDSLGDYQKPTHRVSVPASHIYESADFKSKDRAALSFGSLVTAVSEHEKYIETSDGFIPLQHVSPIATHAKDPASILSMFEGAPYLWGGNSRWGIDCSGLVQFALLSCGITCPGDSDQQMARLGDRVKDGTPMQRNDILFWKGHVAMAIDEDTLLHANAYHMQAVRENATHAIERILAQGDGDVLAHVRL